MNRAGGRRDIEHHTPLAIGRRVLPVVRLAAARAVVRGQAGLRVAGADRSHLVRPARPAGACLLARAVVVGCVTIRGRDRFAMTPRDRLPAHVGPDQRAVDVHDLALGNAARLGPRAAHRGRPGPARDAGRDRARKDPLEALGTPALPNPRQARMVRQALVHALAAEPADRQVHLGFAHQPTIVDDPEQQPGQHQAQRDLGIDPRAAVVGAIEIGHLGRQPGHVEQPVDRTRT